RTAQGGRMFCAPRFWLDPGGHGLLGTMGILTLVLCSCSGQPMFLLGDLPTSSTWEHYGGDVFIHMDSSWYSLPCSTLEMEVAKPTYHWVWDRMDPKFLSVTEDGHLLFQHFQASDSGNYSCTISYMKHGLTVSQTFHYSVLGYHVLGGLETLLLFHSKLCEDEWTKMLLWDLQEKLKQLEIKEHCKIQPKTTSCFPSIDNPFDEFVLQVHLEVSFFGPNWDEHCKPQDAEVDAGCYRRTLPSRPRPQVQLALAKFFKEHKSFHITGPDKSIIIFTNVFIGFLEIKQCSMGYGQTKQLRRCPECCIVCPPGTFSLPTNRQCSPCPVGTYSLSYGKGLCTACKHDMITREPGASSMDNCVDEGIEKVDSIIHKIPLLLLIILPPLIAINALFIFSTCYWFHQEYRTSSSTTSNVSGITKIKEKVIKFLRTLRGSPRSGPPASDTSDLHTSDLGTNVSQTVEEERVSGILSTTGTPSFAAPSDDAPAVLELEDKREHF
ncbi:ZPBP2 protein, partial [Penelope pileata]|nr:ZPBP2 protein [Penelope pileata]